MRTDRLSTISRSIPCISRQEGLPTPLDTDPPGHMTCDACWEASLRAVKISITSHCLFCVYSWLFYFINSIFVDNCLILKANWNPLHWDFSLLVDTKTCLSFLYNDPLIPIYWCWTNFTAWALADPRGGARDVRPPWGPNSFIFMQFSAKMWKIIAILGVGAPPGKILDPPLVRMQRIFSSTSSFS